MMTLIGLYLVMLNIGIGVNLGASIPSGSLQDEEGGYIIAMDLNYIQEVS